MHWCVKIYWALSSSVTPNTSADSGLRGGLHSSAEQRPEGFHSAKHSISVCAAHWPPLSSEKDRTAESPRTLRIWTQDACAALRHLRGTVNVSVMGLRDGDGNEHTVIHQPSMALLPFRYRYPLRHKAPAASSGRLTHSIGHQCNTAPFSPLRNAPSERPKCLSIHPSAWLHAQWTEVDSSCV